MPSLNYHPILQMSVDVRKNKKRPIRFRRIPPGLFPALYASLAILSELIVHKIFQIPSISLSWKHTLCLLWQNGSWQVLNRLWPSHKCIFCPGIGGGFSYLISTQNQNAITVSTSSIACGPNLLIFVIHYKTILHLQRPHLMWQRRRQTQTTPQ